MSIEASMDQYKKTAVELYNSILQMITPEHREVNDFPKVTQQQ